jgi:hypothetical protein
MNQREGGENDTIRIWGGGMDDNIITDLKPKGKEGMEWFHLAQDRAIWWAVMNTVMNLGFLKQKSFSSFSRSYVA